MLGKGISVVKTETPLICGFFRATKNGRGRAGFKEKKCSFICFCFIFVHTIWFCTLKVSLEMDRTLDCKVCKDPSILLAIPLYWYIPFNRRAVRAS